GSRGLLGGWGCEIPRKTAVPNALSCKNYRQTENQLYSTTSGGAPGQVVVGIVNNPNFLAEKASLDGRIGTTEGADRTGEERGIPNFFASPPNGIGDPALASRCLFVPLKPANQRPLSAGHVAVVQLDSDAAMVNIQSALLQMSGPAKYSYRDLAFTNTS